MRPFWLAFFFWCTFRSINGQEANIDPARFVSDWSSFNVTGGPENPAPVGGILIQWNQRGLDYVASLAKLAFTRLIRGIHFPEAKGDDPIGYEVKNIKITEMHDPVIKLKFLHQTGLGAKILLPKLDMSAKYSASSFFFSSAGTIKGSLRNLVIQILMTIERGQIGHPTFDFPYCDVKVGSLRTVIIEDEESGMIGTINNAKGMLEGMVKEQIGTLMCTAARNYTKTFEILFIDPWSGPWLFDPDVMCPNSTIDTTATGPPQLEIPKTGSAIADKLLAKVKNFSVDVRLNDETVFDDDRVALAIKGDFAYNGRPAQLQSRRVNLPKAREMLAFTVTEHVPDGFLYHVYQRDLAYVDEKLEMSNLPATIRGPVRLLCWNCHLKILAAPTEAPKIRMTSRGVQIHGKGWVKVTAKGFFTTFNVMTGTAEIVADLQFRVTNNVIYGNLTMNRPSVRVSSSGLAGLVAATLAQSLEELIQKKVWPKLRDPVNQVLSVKGIHMPEVCGLSFNNTAISFYDGFVTVGTDLVYDMDGFLTRLLRSLERQRQAALAASTQASG